MAWIESRAVGGRTFYYVIWRTREVVDGKVRRVRHCEPAGESRIVAESRAAEVGILAERRNPRPKHVGPSAALDAFLKEQAEVKRLRPDTIEYYRDILGPIFAALADRGPLRSWQPGWIADFVADHPGWSPRTVQMHLIALRTFAKWARSRGYDCPKLAEDVKGPAVVKAKREAYSPAEARRLLDAVVGRRLEPAVALALIAGLSLGDCRALRWGDVDMRRGWIRSVRSKTGRPIAVPIGKRLRAVLERAVPGHAHQSVCILAKSDSSVHHAWVRLCRRAGVPYAGGLKRCRHTFATILDAANVDRSTRRELMSHAPGSSMESIYTHSDLTRLRKGMTAIDRAIR